MAFLAFFGTKAGMYVLAGLAAVAGLLWFIEHERSVGAEHAIAVAEAKTEKESERRIAAEKREKEVSEASAARTTEQGKTYASKLFELAGASHSNDGRKCLDGAAAERLRAHTPNRR